MKRLLLPLLLATLCAAAKDAAPTPRDFAYGMPVIPDGLASAYRLTLTPDVYRNTVRADLGDVRVFNSRNEAVAHAILHRAASAPPGPAQTLPLFPLRGDVRSPASGLKLTVNPGGTILLEASSASVSMSAPVEQYILDAQKLSTPVASLLLSWPEHSADFSGQLRAEVSDDFSAWRAVVIAAPVANLHAQGQALIENRIDIPDVKAKFWRLSWVGVKAPFELSEVRAAPASGPTPTSWATAFVSGKGDANGVYVFDVGARLPAERVNLSLPEVNSMYMVELSSRPGEQDAWMPVMRSGFYRLATAAGEQRNNPVPIGMRRDRFWRVHILGGAARPESLRLEISWSPADLEFLAQGTPPFMLAYGSSSAMPAEADLSSLPSSVAVGGAKLGPRAVLGGESRFASKAVVWKRSVLWSILILAVLVLGFMAVRLTREQPGRPR